MLDNKNKRQVKHSYFESFSIAECSEVNAKEFMQQIKIGEKVKW